VTFIKNDGRGFIIDLDDGRSVFASKVIDTRPIVYESANQAQIWQIFYGYEIETQEDFFDDKTVGLMENLARKPQATEFIYTLPFNKNRALIELTHFSKKLFNPNELVAALHKYLEETVGENKYKILRSEYACLPMGLTNQVRSTSQHYHYAGMSAGAIRPATGYAFIRIQQWAKLCANKLSARETSIPAIESKPLMKAMDRIFLRALHDKPQMGVELFQALAERVSGQSLVRFLMDEARVSDYYRVITALPKLRFILYSLGINHLPLPRR
jgi:lycopene beta-cyclase